MSYAIFELYTLSLPAFLLRTPLSVVAHLPKSFAYQVNVQLQVNMAFVENEQDFTAVRTKCVSDTIKIPVH